jgi:hypothetical protein
MTEEQLSALLRIKRFEQPPPQYFERLLKDVHERQRAELLRRPLWKIAADRLQTFFSEHSMGHLAYGGALASVLIVGVSSIAVLTSGGASVRSGGAQRIAETRAGLVPAKDSAHLVNLQVDHPRFPKSFLPKDLGRVPALPQVGYGQPRYVIDARPVSYEPPPTINF